MKTTATATALYFIRWMGFVKREKIGIISEMNSIKTQPEKTIAKISQRNNVNSI